MQYQIINLETGDFQVVTLEEAAEIAQLDPHDIAWAIEEHGVCETDIHQITKIDNFPEEDGASSSGRDRDACDGGEAKNKGPLPIFAFLSLEEFEMRLSTNGDR